MAKIFLIDDSESLRSQLKKKLESNADFKEKRKKSGVKVLGIKPFDENKLKVVVEKNIKHVMVTLNNLCC